ncbi:TraA family conjugative transfer protein [Thioalkalivibrio thiocyanodenitrificans]|uniref:TraA family conjugative transfer protein n=1 Tax=Thioalkalivibrio thiocyanodenitrificans TaxID=243063 RepID=UPI00035E13FA|nr:TraA family conjugative transfer protein [Thioalkalivibrio thiocyanodenitrificans]
MLNNVHNVHYKRVLLALFLMLMSGVAMAATGDDPFLEFMETVDAWASGALGIGLAITMLLVGAAMGVAKNSPLPALSGIAGAAILYWGPGVIKAIMGSGALI